MLVVRGDPVAVTGAPGEYAEHGASEPIRPPGRARPARPGGRPVVARASSAARDEALLRGGRPARAASRTELLEANARRPGAGRAAGGTTPPPSTGSASTADRVAVDGRRPARRGRPARPGRRGGRGLGAPERAAGRRGCGCPSGWSAIIYENRPNVTSDAAGLCLKSGNAVLLAGLVVGHRASNRADRRRCCGPGWPRPACPRTPSAWWRTPAGSRRSSSCSSAGLIDCLIPRGGPVADRLDAGARHRALRDRRRRQLPRLRGRRRRPGHGRGHRGQRQDPAARRVQRGRVAPRPPRRWPRPSCPAWRRWPLAGVELRGGRGHPAAARPGAAAATDERLRHRVPGT